MHHTQTCTMAEFVWLYTKHSPRQSTTSNTPYSYKTYVHICHTYTHKHSRLTHTLTHTHTHASTHTIARTHTHIHTQRPNK